MSGNRSRDRCPGNSLWCDTADRCLAGRAKFDRAEKGVQALDATDQTEVTTKGAAFEQQGSQNSKGHKANGHDGSAIGGPSEIEPEVRTR